MATIDFELAWEDLKAYIVSRPSHGKRDLLTQVAEIEVKRRVPEGQEGFDPGPRHRNNGSKEQPTSAAQAV